MVFTSLDSNYGYWKIPVVSEEKYKTSFTIHMGMYRYKRIPFRLRNALYTFQRALDIILSGIRWQRFLLYLGYVIIFSISVVYLVAHVD